MRIAPPVVLDSSQQDTLKQWAGSRSLPARQVERAKVVLLAAAGRTDLEIAAGCESRTKKPLDGASGSCTWAWMA